MQYTKHTVDQYCIRPEKDDTFYWADIFIDVTGPKSGTLIIRSDYGSWDHHWGACGESFTKFLLGLNNDYLMGKLELGQPREFRNVETVQGIKLEIQRSYENREINAAERKAATKEVNSVFAQAHDNEQGYWACIKEQCPVLYEKVFYRDPNNVSWVTSYTRSVERFVAEVWPVFKTILKDEHDKGAD